NTVAIVAKILARRHHVSQDVAFTAGILHEIGTLELVTYHGRAYEAVLAAHREQALTEIQAEQQVLGIEQAEVGTALAR
ncbi:HDOD domain-containing protein, partial [Undibacterium sp. CCC1.1]|uniref:HDOD domain-containing protein n=1 Tax=Undibacterium sp. CCC1.1 TaxID=3048602 RepID=UPI002B222D1C